MGITDVITDSTSYHGIPCKIKVGITKETDEYPAKNKILDIKPVGNSPVESVASQPSSQPAATDDTPDWGNVAASADEPKQPEVNEPASVAASQESETNTPPWEIEG
jgi:hypothetical protein